MFLSFVVCLERPLSHPASTNAGVEAWQRPHQNTQGRTIVDLRQRVITTTFLAILHILEDNSISKHIENEVTDVSDPKFKIKRRLNAILKNFKIYDIPFEKLNIYSIQNLLSHANLSSEILKDPLKYFKYFIRDEDFEEIARNININTYEYEAAEH
jgi:hypothetical protein